MTPETISCCRRYVKLCKSIRDPAVDIQTCMDEAEQVVAMRLHLNVVFARNFEYAELERHSQQLIEAYEQVAV